MANRGRGTLTIRKSDNPFFQPTSQNVGARPARRSERRARGRPRREPGDARGGQTRRRGAAATAGPRLRPTRSAIPPRPRTARASAGEDFSEEVVYKAPVVERPARPTSLADEYDFQFLMKRASEEIGQAPRPGGKNACRSRLCHVLEEARSEWWQTYRRRVALIRSFAQGIEPSDSRLSRAMGQRDTLRDVARMRTGGVAASPSSSGAGAAPPPTATQKVERILESYVHDPREEHAMYMTTNNAYGIMKPNVATFTAERKARSQAFSNSFNGVKYRDQGLNTSVVRSSVHNGLDML